MNTNEIDRLLSHDPFTKTVYGGALARDVFDTRFGETDSRLFVVNTEDSGGEGEHWLAVYKSDDKTYLFDSYGLPRELFPNIIASITKGVDTPIITSPVQLQSLTSTVCGDYCIAFAMALCRGVTFDNFLSYWKNSFSQLQRDHSVRGITLAYMSMANIPHNSGLHQVHIPMHEQL